MMALLAPAFPGRDALLHQLSGVSVVQIDTEGSLEFHVEDATVAEVARSIPVEATVRDVDDVVVHLLLHVVDGLLNELEVYREDSGPLVAPIDVRALEVIVL